MILSQKQSFAVPFKLSQDCFIYLFIYNHPYHHPIHTYTHTHTSLSPGCLTDARLSMLREVHVIFLTGGLRGNAITTRPHNLYCFIFKPGILPFSLISSCTSFVRGSCCFLRWKTVWQSSKSHRTLKVTCAAALFILLFISNMEVMIKRIWAEGEAKRCLLWSKQQPYQSPDPHGALV